jgi:hypothetical protein
METGLSVAEIKADIIPMEIKNMMIDAIKTPNMLANKNLKKLFIILF